MLNFNGEPVDPKAEEKDNKDKVVADKQTLVRIMELSILHTELINDANNIYQQMYSLMAELPESLRGRIAHLCDNIDQNRGGGMVKYYR